jgi:NAD(P)H-hydrate epimerase
VSDRVALETEATLPRLPARDPRGHKGTFGTVCVLGGCAVPPRIMAGAPALAARAALRAGAGLAITAVPAPLVQTVLAIVPEATALALPVDDAGALRPSDAAEILDRHLTGRVCLAVGPGWGTGTAQGQVLVRLLADDRFPLVLDADALNVLAAVPEVQRDWRASVILTPHPGEFRRLAEAVGASGTPRTDAERAEAAADLARRLGCVIVLKGAGTVVTDGLRVAMNGTGTSALATAGTGDVLTGLLAGLVAQCGPDGPGGLDLFDCARLAVHAHGRAAERWAAGNAAAGLTASDLIAGLPAALEERRG